MYWFRRMSLPSFVSRVHTSFTSLLDVSCSLSLRRHLLKAGWSIRVYEENPAPCCSRKQAISSLPAKQDTLLSLSVRSNRGKMFTQYLSPVLSVPEKKISLWQPIITNTFTWETCVHFLFETDRVDSFISDCLSELKPKWFLKPNQVLTVSKPNLT